MSLYLLSNQPQALNDTNNAETEDLARYEKDSEIDPHRSLQRFLLGKCSAVLVN